MYQNDNHEVWLLRYVAWWTEFCHFGPFFPFYPFAITTQKIKILKKWKNTWRYFHFPNVYHKWQSYDVWFLSSWSGTECFCHFGTFFALLPHQEPKTSNFWKKKKKKHPEGNSSQIHQIHVKSKILKSLRYSPFNSLIENRKFQKFQLHSPSCSDFLAILRIFPAEFEDKMWFEAFSGYP